MMKTLEAIGYVVWFTCGWWIALGALTYVGIM